MRRFIFIGSCALAIGCHLTGAAGKTAPKDSGTATIPAPTPTSTKSASIPFQPTVSQPTVGRSPDATIDPDRVTAWLCGSNVNSDRNPLPGRIVRYAIPIAIHPGGNAAVLRALAHYESATGGAVAFRIVEQDPSIGITIVEGDAIRKNGEPGCGNVTGGRSADSGHTFHTDPLGFFNSTTYVHLGSAGCDDESKGNNPESVAEHELGHALGLAGHFPDFTGDEGLSPNLLAVVTRLYRYEPGTDLHGECETPQ